MRIRSIIPIALCLFIVTACSDKKAEPVKDEAEMLSSDEDISKKENKEQNFDDDDWDSEQFKGYKKKTLDVGRRKKYNLNNKLNEINN